MSIQNCLRCKGSCVHQIHGGVEIDQCSQCGGVWLDHGELEAILETSPKGNTPISENSSGVHLNAGISNDARQDHLSCPFCSKTLNVVNFAYDSGVIINRCPNHGIWLDSGELKRIEDNRAFWRAEAAKRESEWKQHLNPSSSTSAQTNQTLLDFFRSIFF
jgi:Zn-finger nucleic acid-binding protein